MRHCARDEGVTVTVERTLDDAHRLLREGRVDGAIEAYAGVLAARPDDWPAANRLGDLYMQTGKIQEAVEQFAQVGEHLLDRDLLPKAAALYKKVLKIVPDDENARLRLAEIAERLGFLVDARTHLTAVAEQRRHSGNVSGAEEAEQRINELDKTAPTRRGATVAPMSTTAPAANPREHWGGNTAQPTERPANDEVATAPVPIPLRPDPVPVRADPVALRPAPVAPRRDPLPVQLAPPATHPPAPRLTRPPDDVEPTAQDRQLQLKLMLIDSEIQADRLKRARQLVGTVLLEAPDGADRILDLAKRMTGENAEATVMCAEVLLEAARRLAHWEVHTAAVAELAAWVPAQPAGRAWPADQQQQLARTGAAARLETMRRESDAILQAFPDLALVASAPEGGHRNRTPTRPPLESVVAAAV